MKKHFFSILGVVILLCSSFGIGFFASKSSATSTIPFGGHLVVAFYCDCSDSWWLYYIAASPSPFPGGALGYLPYGTLTYLNYNMYTPGVWHLGYYLPAVQSCWIYVGYGCTTLPVVGTETMVGTSASPSPF